MENEVAADLYQISQDELKKSLNDLMTFEEDHQTSLTDESHLIDLSPEEADRKLLRFLKAEVAFNIQKAKKHHEPESELKAMKMSLAANFVEGNYTDPTSGKKELYKILRSLKVFSRKMEEVTGSIMAEDRNQRDYNINEHYKTLMFQKMIKDLSIKYDYQEFVDNFDKPEYYNKDIFEL